MLNYLNKIRRIANILLLMSQKRQFLRIKSTTRLLRGKNARYTLLKQAPPTKDSGLADSEMALVYKYGLMAQNTRVNDNS